MKTKTILCATLCAFALNINAEVCHYFFSPEGAGEQDGTSWENAAPGEWLGATLRGAEPGSEFWLMEGSYAADDQLSWSIPEGIIIKGGYPTTSTGTNTEIDYYKNDGRQSIFSADLNGDGVGDNSDYAFVYIGKGKPGEKDDLFYKDFQLTSIYGCTFRDGRRLNSKYDGNMVLASAAKVDFHFCQFLNNQSPITDGGSKGSNGAIEAWGCQLRCFDCIFRDNLAATGGGGAFQVRARNSQSNPEDPADRSVALFNRCELINNIAVDMSKDTTENSSWGTYGGAFSICDGGGTLYVLNSTIANSRGRYRGVGVRVGGGGCISYFINNTFFDNPCHQGPQNATNNGSAISVGKGSTAYFANNIAVDYAANDIFQSGNPVVYIQDATSQFFTAGYNVFGTVTNISTITTQWAATDNIPASLETLNTIETVFGGNKPAENGGWCKTIVPTKEVKGMKVTELQAAVAAWPLDDCVKDYLFLDTDARGYTRAEVTMSGSYDAEGTSPNPGSDLNNLRTNKKMIRKAIIDGQIVILNGGKPYNVLGIEL